MGERQQGAGGILPPSKKKNYKTKIIEGGMQLFDTTIYEVVKYIKIWGEGNIYLPPPLIEKNINRQKIKNKN